MRVTMKHSADAVAVDRFFQPCGPEEIDDFGWLALDGRLNRRVVQHRDFLRHSQARERRFELQSFLDRLVNESFDDVLAPGAKGSPSESAAEAFDARKSDAANLGHASVEHRYACIGEDFRDLALLACLEIVVAEDAESRNAEERCDVLGHNFRLVEISVVGQIAAEQKHISNFSGLREERLQRALRSFLDVQVS